MFMLSINKLFEATFRIYESLMSILTMLQKYYIKNSCVFENKHFSFFNAYTHTHTFNHDRL